MSDEEKFEEWWTQTRFRYAKRSGSRILRIVIVPCCPQGCRAYATEEPIPGQLKEIVWQIGHFASESLAIASSEAFAVAWAKSEPAGLPSASTKSHSLAN